MISLSTQDLIIWPWVNWHYNFIILCKIIILNCTSEFFHYQVKTWPYCLQDFQDYHCYIHLALHIVCLFSFATLWTHPPQWYFNIYYICTEMFPEILWNFLMYILQVLSLLLNTFAGFWKGKMVSTFERFQFFYFIYCRFVLHVARIDNENQTENICNWLIIFIKWWKQLENNLEKE